MIDHTTSKAQALRHEACPKCREKGRDRSGNNLSIYLNNDGTESAHCWSCKYTRASTNFKKETYQDRYIYEIQMAGEFTIDMWKTFKQSTGTDPKGWCALSEEACSKYGVRHQYDEKGNVTFQYYPITKNNDLVGLKWRSVDKKWNNKGEADSSCDLFGQVSFLSSTSKNVILSSGEKDAISIYQMLEPYYKSKGWDTPPVVCSVVGEGGYKQYQNHYEWLDKFEKIIICPDNDEPGIEHLHKLVKVLPRNKVYIMDLPYKDANECLQKGKTKGVLDGSFRPRSYTPSGIVGSDVLKQALLDGIRKTKIPLPPFLAQLQEMLRGGIRIPSIVNIVGPTRNR